MNNIFSIFGKTDEVNNTKDKLLQVKEKLLNDTIEVNENFFKNISKLVELKSSLKNND